MNSDASTLGCFFKQIEERQILQEVAQMLWNPKMDLIALAFINGDVHLYRMNWQKVWSINCPYQHVTITSMAWRPDGKVLAVSFSNGHLRLLAVEDAKKIFSFNCSEPIQWLHWLQENDELSARHQSHNFYDDLSASQMPRPVSYDLISQLFEKANNRDFADNLFIRETNCLTYLVCAHGTSIAIFVYGYFLLVDANLDMVASFLNYKQLKSCFLSDDTTLISALGLTDENLLVYSLLDAKLLQENHIQIKLISTKFGMLFSMLTSIKSVIKEMEELWEDILVEMDQKFQLYALEKFNNNGNSVNLANKPETTTNGGGHGVLINGTNGVASNLLGANGSQQQPNTSGEGSLVHDFMLLYAFGQCSDHFKTFLLHELTEKGLKKLEQSVENYYSNIQRLLSANFQQISLCMFYHLNELYSMTKWFDKFKIFSLTESHVNDVLNNCASLLLKAEELNFVIDQNMKEIKLFFKWLLASILHLSDDQSTTDMIRFNEEMENSILGFIQNTFKDDQTINLEKVGQYLKPDNLRVHISEDNEWQTFLKNRMTNRESEYLHLSKKEKSLIGCFDEFKTSLNECFRCQAINLQQPFTFIKQYNIHKFNNLKDADDMLMSYKCIDNSMLTGLLMAKNNNECYVLKHPVNNDPDVKAYIINLSSQLTVDLSQVSLQDVYIYSDNSVTLLGTDNKTYSSTYLIQLYLQPNTASGILNDLIEVQTTEESKSKSNNLLMIKAEKLSTTSIVKCIKKLKSSCLCVSSSRKVAALLSASRHRVKIFELEVTEDEEDESEMIGTTGSGMPSGIDTHDTPTPTIEDQQQLLLDQAGDNESVTSYDTIGTKPSTILLPQLQPQPMMLTSNDLLDLPPIGSTTSPDLINKLTNANLITMNQNNNAINNNNSGAILDLTSASSANTLIIKQFSKQQSSGRESVCSSTAATVGTSATLDGSNFTRSVSASGGGGGGSGFVSISTSMNMNSGSTKRKKNFDGCDEEDYFDDDNSVIENPINELLPQFDNRSDTHHMMMMMGSTNGTANGINHQNGTNGNGDYFSRTNGDNDDSNSRQQQQLQDNQFIGQNTILEISANQNRNQDLNK